VTTVCSRCLHTVLPGAMAFVVGDGCLCWRCRQTVSAICPHCCAEPDSAGKPPRICRTCQQPRRFVLGLMLTNAEATLLSQLRTLSFDTKSAFRTMTGYEWSPVATNRDKPPDWALAALESVSSGRGRGPAHSESVVASVAERLGIGEDPMLSLLAARTLWEMGRDHIPSLRAFHISGLRSLQQLGVKWVRIQSSHDSCPACKRLSRLRKRWRLEEAIAEQPLPHPDCTTDLEDEGDDNEERVSGAAAIPRRLGWCRCNYSAD
jgi:hypothetical protein